MSALLRPDPGHRPVPLSTSDAGAASTLLPASAPAGLIGEGCPPTLAEPLLCRHSIAGVRCGIALVESRVFPGYLAHAVAPRTPHYPTPFRSGPDPDRYMDLLRELRVEVGS